MIRGEEMLVIGIYLIIMIVIMYISYRRLKSFDKRIVRILVTLVIFILTFIMQILLTGYGLINNEGLEEMGKGLIVLVLIIPLTIMVAEAILMPLYTYLINKYNKGEITRNKFTLYILIILLLNDISVLLFYI